MSKLEALDTLVQRVQVGAFRKEQWNSRNFVYAIGVLRPFFASKDLQKEFDTAATALGLKSDDYYGVFSHTVTDKANSDFTYQPYYYLAEKACWIFSINNIDTYFMVPRFDTELNEMINALKNTGTSQVQAIIGTVGRQAPADYCAGLALSLVLCHHLVSEATTVMLDVPLKLNDGTASQKRAMNYVAFNYQSMVPDGLVLPKPLREISYQFYGEDTERTLVEIILGYIKDGIEIYYSCGVDVTDQYPFIDFPIRQYLPDTV